jgi:hypothetical protein
MTNSPLGLLKISIAYKLTIAAMGLSEANYVATQLNLPCHKPIVETEVIHRFVAPPGLGEPKLPTTTLETSNYWFCFRHGKLFALTNTRTNIEEVEHYKEWAKMPSLIGTNEAYRLATQWLSAISVDVPALERRYKAHVGQPFFWGDQGTNQVFLPIFYVTWGDPRVVDIGVFGPTRQITGLGIEDPSFLTRTNLFLSNDTELNNIPDPPKKKLVLPDENRRGPFGKSPTFSAPGLARMPDPQMKQLKNPSPSVQTNSTSP